jgi:hypothetical protein
MKPGIHTNPAAPICWPTGTAQIATVVPRMESYV